MLNYYFGSFVPRRKQVAYAVESAFPTPFGWSQHRKLYKGGNFFEDIGNSVSGFFSDPISYTGDRLAEIDKTVIQPVYREVIQPVGKVLEGVGKAIANDPITFVATVAAVATGNAWMVPIIQGISTAAHGGSVEDIVKTVAISAATTWAGGQIGEYVSSGMQVSGGGYELFGQAIEKTTAQTIGNVVGYSSASAVGAAAMGKNGDQILTTALANGAGAALPLVLGNIPGFNDLAAGKVAGLAPDVSKAIANGIAGVAGSVVSAAITHKDIGAAAAAGLITAGINGLVSTKNMVTDMFKSAGESIGVSNLSTQTQAIIANTMSNIFATALNGGKAGNILQQSMLSVGTQALQKYITTGIKDGANLVSDLFKQSESVADEFDTVRDSYVRNLDIRNGIADQINGLVDKQQDLAAQYDKVDNALDAYLIKSQGYQEQYDQKYSAYQSYVNQANALVAQVNTKGNNVNSLAGKVNTAAQDVNNAIAQQKAAIDAYNARYDTVNSLTDKYNSAVKQDAVVATDRMLGAETYDGAVTYLPPGTQVAYGADGRYAYKTVGPEGYIRFDNNTFGDPIQGTYKYGYAVTFGGYTSSELEAMKNDISAKTNELNGYAAAANDWASKATNLTNTYNTLNGQYQTALTDYNNTKAAHDSYAGKASSALDSVNQVAAQLNQTNTLINQSIEQIKTINSQITATNSQYTSLSGQLTNYDSLVKTNESTLTTLKSKYDDLAVKLDGAATPLTQQINELTSKVTNDLVATLDPSFDAAQYKEINNLGGAIDAATHWLSIGKDQGLYTNKAAADAAKYEAVYDLATSIAKQRGYASGFDVSNKEWAQLYSDIEAHYGNNIAAMKSATPGTFAWETGKPVSQMLSAFDESKLAENTSSKETYGAWNAPDNLVLPNGTKLATANDYATGKATAIQTKDGNVAYVVSDGTQTVKIRDNEGNLVNLVVGSNHNGEGVYIDSNGVTHVNVTIKGADGRPITGAGSLDTVTPEEQDPLQALYTFNTMQSGLLGDWSKPGDRIIEGSKSIIAWAEEKAKTGESSNVLAIASNVVGGFGEQFQSFAGLAALVGDKPENTDLYKLGQKLLDIQKASTPADFAKRYSEFQAQYQNVTGLEKGWAFLKGAANYPSEFMMGMVLPEIVQEVIPTLFGAGVKVVGMGANALTSALPKVTDWVSKWGGVAGSAASDVAESFGSNYNETYKEAKNLAAKAHPEWGTQQIEEYATKQGLTVGLMGALTTGISMGVGGASLAKSLLGPKASAEAVDGLTGWIGNIASKMTSTGKILIKEGLSESLVEEMPTQLVKDLLFLDIDPNRDIAGNVALAGAQAFTTAGMTTGTISAAHNTAMGLAEVALSANDAFMNAINGTNGNAAQLTNVLNQWLPMSTAAGATLRNTVVPAIFDTHPTWANQYSTAAAYEQALSGFGVTDATAITETANTKFNQNVVTSDELTTQLYNQGLVDVSLKDIQNVLGTGKLTTDQINTAAAQYVNANMISQAEVQAAAKQEGYDYTQAEMDSLVGRGVQADVIAKFITEIDPKAVTKAEASQYFKDLGYTDAAADEIAQFVKSVPEEQIKQSLGQYVDVHQVTRNEAVQFYQELGYVPTEQEIQQFIKHGKDIQQAQVKSDLGGYVDPRMVDSQEVKDMLSSMGLLVPVGEADVARLTGQYMESELGGKAKEALPVIAANATYAETKRVADLVGKPASQVTQADFDTVNSMIAGKTATNLAYDTNNDGKIDQSDVVNIQNQLNIQQNQNVNVTTDPDTGLNIYTDTQTGKVINPNIQGSQWAPTGLYKTIADQKAQQEATAKAQATAAKQAQQKNQFSQMMQMVLGAPDAAGQKVEVGQSPLAEIKNIYDWSSIFATPQQANFYVSPYGQVNTYGQQPQQSGLGSLGGVAANNPMYKQASGFAEGGMIDSDMSVGDGGSIDDLLNILKGNSG